MFQLTFIVALIAYQKISFFFAGSMATQSVQVPGLLESLLVVGLFLFTCYSMIFSTGDAVVYFTASEVAFLFPAPLDRKQLLLYALVKGQIAIVGISFGLTFLANSELKMAVPSWIAMVLTMSFLQLLTMTVAFVRQILRLKFHLLIRLSFGLFVGAIVLIAANQIWQSCSGVNLKDYEKHFVESTKAILILAPFRVFAWAIFAPDWVTFLPAASILLVIDLLLRLFAIRLDALSLEASLAITEKMTTRLRLMRTKGVWQAFGATSAVARRRIPMFPFWQGLGPVAWERLTTLFRSSNQLIWLLGGAVVFVAGLVCFLGSPWAGVGGMTYLSLLVSLTWQNEIEQVGYLKSLPIPSRSIVLGELIGIPILLSIIQLLFVTIEFCFFPSFDGWLLFTMVAMLPMNFLLFGIDKLVFFVYPTRLGKGAPGDFQNAGKQMIFMTFKMALIGLAISMIAIATLPGALFWQSPIACAVPALVVMVIECIALIPILTAAFDRFDPGMTLVS